jgi:C4-dicarboxylate transporter DctM subunit
MTALLFIALFVLMFLGIPIAFSLLLSCSLMMYSSGFADLLVVVQRTVRGLDSFTILACPLFILAGYIMEESSMSQRLVEWVTCIFGKRRGSVGVVTIIACAIFAALTGSGPATVAAIGAIMYPALVQNGYPKGASAGLVATGGALGPIIPPSIPMIIYGTTMGISISKMFMGGIVPGVAIAAALIIVNNFLARNKYDVKVTEQHYTAKEKLKLTWRAAGTLFMPILVLGGIYGGVFTPTEAAGIACVYSTVIAICYRSMTPKKMVKILVKSAETTAVSMLIVGTANLFAWILAATKIPTKVTGVLVPLLHNKTLYMMALLVILMIVGCLMETIASISILAPIIVPTGIALGIDELHLAIIFVTVLVVGFVTPPFGVNLFTAASITDQRYTDVVKGALPFMFAAMAVMIILAFLPQLTTFLPNLIYGQ